MNGSDREAAADVLRAWALDEDLKEKVMASPLLAPVASRIARQYSAGDTVADAVEAAQRSMSRGHLVSIEYAGESVRDADLARHEATVFLELISALREAKIASTVSFDLSHVGLLLGQDLAMENVRAMAKALAPLGTSLMISAEGSDRTDLVLDTYDALIAEELPVGITIQARMHRSAADLERLLERPGVIRLVKGAFLEPADRAYQRGSSELQDAYLRLAGRILEAGHALSIATHDAALIGKLTTEHPDLISRPDVEFEMLLGLGTATLDQLHKDGYTTREYSIFGDQWWLYVLNRIAEEPERVFTALVAAAQ
ncbi:proline dehydrogenase family protein [Paenarthrobacter sp. AR 02]|uniref:proline dehydrogenase family protein n=1 Tax=Paenarthrobacter sp. AR 02 TaxID=2899821 RepID=UPI001F2E2138|nr:proline dehydrogenase family protein [Paenarthrobacter sp. AR 02]MCF3141425.1 proline dehydrogenase family protein [Paenarthrobacter sp. AR 02]